MAVSQVVRRIIGSAHPESDFPNEPAWNFVAVFWGVFLVAFVAIMLALGSIWWR